MIWLLFFQLFLIAYKSILKVVLEQLNLTTHILFIHFDDGWTALRVDRFCNQVSVSKTLAFSKHDQMAYHQASLIWGFPILPILSSYGGKR